MINIGLTGSIGMGKSTTLAMFEAEGVPVYDADAEVHRIYAKGGAAVEPLEAAFPGVVLGGAVDRTLLSERVVGKPDQMDRLNRIVWPLLGAGRSAFVNKAQADQAPIVVFDIPMLFETGGQRNMDVSVLVSAPADQQRERVLARDGMTPEKFEAILARQMPDAEKRELADYIIDTSRGFEPAQAQVRDILKRLRDPNWRSPRLDGAREAGQ